MSQIFSKILFLTLIAFFSINAFAQATTGTIEGTVTDTTGAVVPGATVLIKNSITSFEKSVITDQNGYYIFTSVLIGSYKFTISLSGFMNVSGNIEILSDRTANVSPVLSPGRYDSYHTEFGSTKILTETNADNGTKFIKENYEEFPARTTFGSLLKIVPFVRPEILASGFQINGASIASDFSHSKSSSD